jgi:hypothetical protein
MKLKAPKAAELEIRKKEPAISADGPKFFIIHSHIFQLGGYRSFEVRIYKSADAPLEVGQSYVVFVQLCGLNSELFEYTAASSWDDLSQLESIKNQIKIRHGAGSDNDLNSLPSLPLPPSKPPKVLH